MKKFYWLIICLTAGFVLFFIGTPVHAAKAIKVGIVDCYSGPPSTYTNDVRDAFKLATDKINEKGGVLGRKIEFVTRDSKFKVDIGLSAAKELIMREEVDILMGTINSSLALGISDLAKKEKIPFLVTFSKSAKITGEKGHRYVFSMNENTIMAGKAGAAGLAKHPYVRYWIAGDDYEYGHAIADGVWKNLKQLKPDVQKLGESWWKVGEPDFTPYITAILSAKPDAVIVATGGRDCVPFLKAARATGFNKQVPFYMHTATELSTLMPLGSEAPEGVIGTSNYHFYFPDTPENKAFAKDFKDAYGRYPKVGALYGYITATFIAKAYEKAGKADTEKFIDALEGMSVDSPVGPLKMRAYDHQVMFPMFMGLTKKSPEHEFLMATDIVTIPGDVVMPTIEEIKKARCK
ncbi:ABC transporter substrate-binding protein [Desulfonema magnum]|uniref:Leucine-binding domain-containing protein n=1 Tax=Desulfonema magnum TaxID=45655 RepID=A0A975BGJ7_9BACT|nr:ABC transporter substrate-binding protein [Desulfonema magnum]QTA85021.1 Leucine-binding domain-containing protein [Desulfonema magnum]